MTVEIEELVMSLPGVAPDEAPALADDIMRAVSMRLETSVRGGAIHRAQLTVRVSPGATRAELIASVVDAIEGALT